MFEACGTKVAMANGSDEVKEKADYVTLSNEESGVADYIYKFILK
jgi:hydroxymethylpyrimidine pyrophosphatase-like HAD family hydrolase